MFHKLQLVYAFDNVAQQNSISRLPPRYGSMYNPNVKYSIPPPSGMVDQYKGHTDHDDFPVHEMTSRNEYDGALEDFTNASNEARIFPPICAKLFAQSALVCDPIKVQWWSLHQLNECHPSLVKVPTMVVSLLD